MGRLVANIEFPEINWIEGITALREELGDKGDSHKVHKTPIACQILIT